eukprot:6337366-Pyramimonas_sp.AAC.1
MSDPLLRSKHAARCPVTFLTLYSVYVSKAGAFALFSISSRVGNIWTHAPSWSASACENPDTMISTASSRTLSC